jgi:multiple sugar transport system ATP-binding protein
MTMGTRIAVFNKGHIEQLGAPLTLYNEPANEFVAGFLGAPRINLVDRPTADSPPAHRALWAALTARSPQAHRAGLRAEHLRIDAAAAAGSGIAAQVVAEHLGGIAAQVVLAEHLGDSAVVYLRVEGVAEMLHAKVDAARGHLGAGQAVALQPDAAWALAFDASGKRLPNNPVSLRGH